MKILLLLIIRLYWVIIPKSKRRKCLFKTSCSQFVYQTAEMKGLYKGLLALNYRFKNCRNGFHIFNDPIDGNVNMVLPNGQIITENEISERFIKMNIYKCPKNNT